ncbi:hypothetical protein [Streptacidiphilus anmyonensis]|uniref:hypothetical protein n=1 Tax=Streptacidiphilus anmyonensis TaxID=405782 RepID=UPI0005A9CA77|nr:hypothetical protein [Streptacidiphilus anmyonensis]
MYLLLHHLATNRFARLGAVLILGLILTIVVALTRQTHTQPSTTAIPACVSQPDTAATQACVTTLFDWCKVNEPTVEVSKCSAAVLTEAAIRP